MSVQPSTLSIEASPGVLDVVAHRPGRVRGPAVLLTPGAGGDLDGAGLTALCSVLADLGCLAVRANLPHNQLGRRAPRADRSVNAAQQLVEAATRAFAPRGPWVLGGKSYGGRVMSMAVAAGTSAAGLLFYGYPLHPPGKPERLRVEHWPDIDAPCLFLQGDRDTFATPSLLDANVRKLPRRQTVHRVVGADHSLKITGAASPTGQPSSPEATIATLRPVLEEWLATISS